METQTDGDEINYIVPGLTSLVDIGIAQCMQCLG